MPDSIYLPVPEPNSFANVLANSITNGFLAGVSNLLASLGHTGRRKVVLGHTLNTQTLTKTDEQKKKKRFSVNL